ncbi:MAG: hypothetical protein HRU19_16950 [Pseudobacteriovorax sp.]|nr:hypothetical protein [Pseudobacteriovorax sp.]
MKSAIRITLITSLLVSCGTEPSDYELKTVPDGHYLHVGDVDTGIKSKNKPSSDLKLGEEKCSLYANTFIPLDDEPEVEGNLLYVTTRYTIPGCSFSEGYVYAPHLIGYFDNVPSENADENETSKAYMLVGDNDSWFKKTKRDSATLSEGSEKCLLKANSKVTIEPNPIRDGNNLLVTTKKSLPGCDFTEGYVFGPHFKTIDSKSFDRPSTGNDLRRSDIQGHFIEVGIRATWLKKTPEFAADLEEGNEKCLLEGETFYPVQAEPKRKGNYYLVNTRFMLNGCGFSKGYVYKDHLNSSSAGISGNDNFAKVMPHILRWEGGCSDHPSDRGGRTYMGITTARARFNGWRGDVCSMPRSKVISIYKKDYYNIYAKNYKWPLNLAIMNTSVNSGNGRSSEFLSEMKQNNISGNYAKAIWFVNRQQRFYRAIVAANSSQRVFLQGWTNRSNYMLNVIRASWSGRASSFSTPLSFVPRESLGKAIIESDKSASRYHIPEQTQLRTTAKAVLDGDQL